MKLKMLTSILNYNERSKDKIEAEMNRLNHNLKVLGKDKEYKFEMFSYGRNSYSLNFRKL